ncbi:MAG: DUF502 domain-containing protein [bacterium]
MSKLSKKIFSFLKALFLNGFFFVLPIAFSLFFVSFSYNFIGRLLSPLRKMEPLFLREIPGSEFIVATVLIIVLGFIVKAFLARVLIHYFEQLVAKIPLIRIVYSSTKTVVDFFKLPEKMPKSHQVVLIHYPRKEYYHLAFLLDSDDKDYVSLIPESEKACPDAKYCKVFMPHSPNPTTGYFFILPESEVIYTDISFEEAIKTLVSCGLITPESLLLKSSLLKLSRSEEKGEQK